MQRLLLAPALICALTSNAQPKVIPFTYMEEQTIKKGVSLHDLTMPEMDKFWNEAKKSEF